MSEEIKHSPTPWTCAKRSLDYSLTDAKGFYFGAIEYSGHVVNQANAAHIVKCVNLHDELVKALGDAVAVMNDQQLSEREEEMLATCTIALTKAKATQ